VKIVTFILIIFILAGCSTNWHTFQANNARTGVMNRPEIQNPEIKWKTYVGIQGYLNNSIINSGTVFVGSSGSTHNMPDDLDGIYSIKKETGKINWHFKTMNDACGVTFSKNKIYATGDDGYLRCLNAINGTEIWNFKREGELFSQPLIISNYVIVGDASGKILIVNKNSGKIIIEKKVADSNVRGGLSSDGVHIYATFMEGIIACLDLEGTIVWKVKGEFNDEYGKDFDGIYAAPTISGNQLIVPFVRSTYYDTPAVYSFNKTNGALLWKASDLSGHGYHGNIRSSVAIVNGYIYYGSPYSHALTILNLKDGVLVNEIGMGEITDPHWPSPVIANNMLYLGRHDGGFNAVDIEKQEVVWQLFIGDHKNIKSRSKEYGQIDQVQASRNGFPIPSIYATPSIDKNGTLYIGSGEGWMYAIGNKKTLSTKKVLE